MKEFDNIAEHKSICTNMTDTYTAKNHDYGDSFSRAWGKYGPVSAIVRMDDKLARAHKLLCEQGERKVKDATVEDTLLDLANYAIMSVIEIRKQKAELIEIYRVNGEEIV